MQRGSLLAVWSRDAHPFDLGEEVERPRFATLGSHMHNVLLRVISRVNICVKVLDQELRHLLVSVVGREMKCRVASIRLHVCPVLVRSEALMTLVARPGVLVDDPHRQQVVSTRAESE